MREKSAKADDSQRGATHDGKQEAQAREQSVGEIVQGDSQELAKLRNAVK